MNASGSGRKRIRPATDTSCAAATRRLLLEQGRLIQHNVPAVIAGNPAALHDVRVAIRRLRTLLKIFRRMLESTPAKHLSRRLKKLTDTLSSYRDVDTQLRMLSSAPLRRLMVGSPGWSVFLKAQRMRQQSSKKRLTSFMQSSAVQTLMEDLGQFLKKDLAVLDQQQDEVLNRAIVKALRKSMQRVEERSRIPPTLPPGPAHALRIACRRTRYMGEFFGRQMSPAIVALARRMKSMQDLLGDLHDIDVHLQHLATVRACPPKLVPEFRRRRKAIAVKFCSEWRAFITSRTRLEIGKQLGI